jgi:hypothetical protein
VARYLGLLEASFLIERLPPFLASRTTRATSSSTSPTTPPTHRGQLTTMLRQVGATPPATDFLVFRRESPAG